MRRFLLILLAVSVVACRRSSPNISGIWSGTLVDDVAGSSTLQFTLEQARLDLSGTAWMQLNCTSLCAIPSVIDGSLSGSLSEFIDISAVSLRFTANPNNNCVISITATITDAVSMSGSYTSCSASSSGTFSATKVTTFATEGRRGPQP